MRKFAKPLFLAAGLFVLVYALAILGLNIYLQSEGLQKRIRTAAESAAGTPVKIRATHYTPWSGFTISGLSIQGNMPAGQAPFLKAVAVSFRFSLLALLQGKLVVSEVVVSNPVLMVQSAPPSPPKPPKPSSTPRLAAATAPSGAVEISAPEAAPTPSPVEVRKVRIAGGSVNLYDSRGVLAATLSDVEVAADILPDQSISGSFRIEEAGFGAFVRPRRFAGTFRLSGGWLVIPDLQADWSGGKLTSSIVIGPSREATITVAATDVLIKQLVEDAGFRGDGSRGRLVSSGSFYGVLGNPDTFTGQVGLSLQEARFEPLDVIRQIGELLSIEELQMLELKTAKADFEIRNQKISAESIVLESDNLVLDAKGPIGFDGKLKLQAHLHLNARLQKDLGGFLSDELRDSDREGYRQVPFTITGSVSRPRTDLLDKVVGFRIGQDVGGLLKNLFRAAPKPSKADKPTEPKPGGG